MRRLVTFTICLIAVVFMLSAQKIHWITFIDTDDQNVGEIDVLGREVLYNNFINQVNAALAPVGYKSEMHDYYGSRVSPENCKAIVEGLKTGSDDIIVFYYIGHGGRPSSKNVDYIKAHPFPQMCFAQWDEKKFIPLEWVGEKLSSKGARLAVTIGMCCNNPGDISIKDAPKFSPNYGAAYMSENKIAKIQELFLNTKGSVIATSASPGQPSSTFVSDFGEIDAYTTVLCLFFKHILDNYTEKLTWDDLFSILHNEVNTASKGRQTPFHQPKLTSANAPNTKTSTVPSQKEVENVQRQQPAQASKNTGNGADWVNKLNDILASLIDTSLPEDDRIHLEMAVSDLFAKNAQVRMLSQDGDIVIDRESASSFLGRLATSRLLLNVSVVEGDFDANQQITQLKVKEVYKK